MSDTDETANIGDVIQLAPPHRWAGSLWIVDEVHKWGVTAYHTSPGATGTAYTRLAWGQFAIVGPASYRLWPTKSAPMS